MGDAPARVGASPAAVAALDRFFDAFYRRRPVAATFTGLHAHDGVLPDWSARGLADAAVEMRQLRDAVAEAGCVPDRNVVRFPGQVDLALADACLEIALAEHESGHFVHRNASLWTGEAIFGVLSLVTREFAPLPERLAAAERRLRAIPAFLQGARAVLGPAPKEWTLRATRECEVAARLFGVTLPAWADAEAGPSASWRAASTEAAQAVAEFGAWLGTDLPDAPPQSAQSGRELLGLLLTRGHWVDQPVDELLADATAALAEADSQLAALARPHGGWPVVQEALAAQHPAADGYLARFHDRWRACWQAAHDHDLVTWPAAPLRYVPFPAHTRDAAPQLYYLHYRCPAPFDPPAVFDYVVPPLDGLTPDETQARLRAVNDSVITLNHVVHHGAIGHHVQNHHAMNGASRIGRVAAVDTANRIAMFPGGSLAEGWACYVCDLMDEVGFLTPLERVAQQQTRVRIAARAVADVSLHSGRASLDDIAALYATRAHMSQSAARAEAVKNSMFPGTAVMYWLGTREIHRLRAEVSARQGSAFSMRRFHDRFLSYGAIPVPLISRLMLADEAAR